MGRFDVCLMRVIATGHFQTLAFPLVVVDREGLSLSKRSTTWSVPRRRGKRRIKTEYRESNSANYQVSKLVSRLHANSSRPQFIFGLVCVVAAPIGSRVLRTGGSCLGTEE